MTGFQAAKLILAIIVVAVICGSGYVFYRYAKNPSTDDIRGFSSSEHVKGIPPTICVQSSGGFDGAGTGSVYIYEGMIRMDLTFSQSNQSVTRHLLIDSTGVGYVWQNGSPSGVKLPDAFQVHSIENFTTFAQDECSPWWLPDASFFEVPASIRFTSVASQPQ